MDAQTLILVFVIIIVGFFVYSFSQIRGKIYCTFRRENKTKIAKFVTQKSHYVYFDPGKGNPKGRYNINTKRITLLWWNKGIFQFFPQLVPSLDFSWFSPNPHDPETFEVTWDTPEAREASQQEDSWNAFAKGIKDVIGKKTKLSDMLMPIVTIGVVVVVGYLVYSQGQDLAWTRMALTELARNIQELSEIVLPTAP